MKNNAGYSSYQTQHRMASETGTKSVSGTSPGLGETSTATTTLYYRSLVDKETGAEDKGIYYNDAATGNVVRAKYVSSIYSDWSVNIAENEYATQSEIFAIFHF